MTPIFQMIFEPEGNSFGLVFSEEKEVINQPVFVLPTKHNNKWWTEEYYLPGEINENYKEFKLTFQNELLILYDEALSQNIRFAVWLGGMFSGIDRLDEFVIYENLTLKYLGKHKDLVASYDGFIPLIPLDLLIMDDAFRRHKACFVGLTPVFGERNSRE